MKNNSKLIWRGATTSVILLTLGFSVSSLSGDVVVAKYQFDGGSAISTDTDSFTLAGDYSISSVSQPNLTNGQQPMGYDVDDENVYFFSGGTADSLANSITYNDFHSFTLETGGNFVSLDSLDFDQGFVSTHPTLSFSVAVLSSFDGFATAGTVLDSFTISDSSFENGGSAIESRTIDLSGITELQNVSTDIEFRIYFYDNSSANDRSHTIDNITLTASSVVIPEPSSMALIFAVVSFGSTLLMRRGKRNA
ncbi:PEP-CTERM sorting domain-containing protein [Coraliomargarita sp. SDUM461004]|uniref:PEP-CTERM sorting domain-containing protein n=1 Tax=Thalassobacterium sedimentorum TaxID=3041258 RepID=A0ABU1AH73_9BACT|nr:PEP-CTERM sorting domain-containing protein [Coraliomargarita sp. SDUM461004]MDQ8192983.1 PEP-CTERM sorting domain-containing protein [Coraliomargarita sp. SDUM461004]